MESLMIKLKNINENMNKKINFSKLMPLPTAEYNPEFKGTRGMRLIYSLKSGANIRKYFQIVSNLLYILEDNRKLRLQYRGYSLTLIF